MPLPVEPEAIGFGEFLRAHRVRPADVQREYIWRGEQVNALMRDLWGYLERKNNDIGSPGYFIGTFVGYREDDDIIRLYDGLQRTTTLTILMAIVRDLIGDEPLAAALHECIRDERGAFRFVIEQGTDDTLQQHIQPRGKTLSWPKTQKVQSRFVIIEEVRRTILDFLQAEGIIEGLTVTDKGRNMLRGFAAVLYSDIYIVHLEAESRSLALRMFETVNMRGVTMEDVDLIKTRLPDIAANKADADTLMAQWDRLRGRVRYEFRDFVLAVNVIFRNHQGDPEDAPFEALTNWMAGKYETHPQVLTDWLNTLIHYADAWNDIHAVQKPGWKGSPGLVPLRPIWVIDWFEWKPYAMMLVRKWQKMRDEARRKRKPVQTANAWLGERLDRLHRAAMALDIARDEPKRRRAYFYGARIRLAKEGAKTFLPEIKAPRRRRIRNTLSGPLEDRVQRLRLLTWYEATENSAAQAFLLKGNELTPTVEHILPQNPPAGSDWFGAFPDAVSARRCRNLLGNLVLLPSWLNAKLDNQSYGAKRDIVLAELTNSLGYSAAVAAFEHETWTQDTIDARTQAIGAAVWERLGLGSEAPMFITDGAAQALDDVVEAVRDEDEDTLALGADTAFDPSDEAAMLGPDEDGNGEAPSQEDLDGVVSSLLPPN